MTAVVVAAADGTDDLRLRHQDLARRHRAEMILSEIIPSGRGIRGLVEVVAEMVGKPVWLVDTHHRVVTRSAAARSSQFRVPDVEALRDLAGASIDVEAPRPCVVAVHQDAGLTRRHVVMPIARGGDLFAWLIVAEVPTRVTGTEVSVIERAGFHLAGEYAVQQRVAKASWNARAALTRQLVRGSVSGSELIASADYLGIQVSVKRVIIYLTEPEHGGARIDDADVADRLGRALGVEVLAALGSEGLMLLVEAPEEIAPVAMVQRVKLELAAVLRSVGVEGVIAGVSAVTSPDALQRAYRETREVALCIDRFSGASTRILAVDDLGPARLFVANSDVASVRRYVHDVLGALLDGRPGTPDLLRTLQCFFDSGRSVRESSTRLGIHENTVRLRLGKVHDLTGLDVAADPNDQLSVQTALLVLRLEGHPAVPPLEELEAPVDRAVSAS